MSTPITISRSEILEMEKVTRLQLINSISGFKSANLLGTVSKDGQENLAIFNSVVHIGSNPPLVGCILRPLTVPRHTYENIRDTGWFTINHVHKDWYKLAHQTSGNYREDLSEFEISGLSPQYSEGCPAPYVAESSIKLGLTLEEQHEVKANGTILLVGAIQELRFPQEVQEKDGFLDLEKAGTVTISGIDAYHRTTRLGRESYVRVPDDKARRG